MCDQTPLTTQQKRNKFVFKKGSSPFNVMSSLTRRSAVSVSKSLYNINIGCSDLAENEGSGNKKSAENDAIYANLEEVKKKQVEEKKEPPEPKRTVEELSSRFYSICLIY